MREKECAKSDVRKRGRKRSAESEGKSPSHDRRRRLFADAAHGSDLYGVPYFTSNTHRPFVAFSPRRPRRHLQDVLFRFSRNGTARPLSLQFRSAADSYSKRGRVYGSFSLLSFSPSSSHFLLQTPRFSRSCIQIPDASESRLSGAIDRLRGAFMPGLPGRCDFRRDCFISRAKIPTHTGVGVVVSIFPVDS